MSQVVWVQADVESRQQFGVRAEQLQALGEIQKAYLDDEVRKGESKQAVFILVVEDAESFTEQFNRSCAWAWAAELHPMAAVEPCPETCAIDQVAN